MHVDLHDTYQSTVEGKEAAGIVSACVHCGFCLATCPTYLDSRDERDSPRGRIYLIKQLLETGEATAQTHTHLDRCLTCRNCETTCPSGVRYGRLVDIGRGLMEHAAPRPPVMRAFRHLLRKVLSKPALFGLLLGGGQILRPLLPAKLKSKIPSRQLRTAPLPAEHSRSMLTLTGCVQKSATPNTTAAAVRILDQLGISLNSISNAGCCGAVNYHLSAHSDGLNDMRRNIDAWWPAIEAGAEAIVITASGCGAMVAEYGELLAHDPVYAQRAARVSALAKDVSEILLQENLEGLRANTNIGKVAVHTPCTLQHALKLPDAIPTLLRRIGFDLARTRDEHLCCGSAGTYSILQGEISERLRDNKLRALNQEKAAVIATGNVGCQLQLGAASNIPVVHWLELLE
jgi:glycolate oxidase iron-sulfur subunit